MLVAWYSGRTKALVTDPKEALRLAMIQAVSGPTIGKRETPVISIWPMLGKWERHGSWWTYIGTDGDAWIEDGTVHEPDMLQIFCIRFGNQMLQLAWHDPALRFGDPRTILSEHLSIKELTS